MSAPLGIGPLSQESAPLRRKLVATLRRLLETGVLAAGQRLIEKDLTAELGVSRTVLREALRELEADGLLAAGPRGLSVAVLARGEAEKHLCRARGAGGGGRPPVLQRADEAARDTLTAAHGTLARAYAAGDLGAILDAKLAFYEALCAGAENSVARDLLGRLNARISLLRARSLADPGRKVASVAEIDALVSALLARDAARAAALAERHVMAAAQGPPRPRPFFPIP